MTISSVGATLAAKRTAPQNARTRRCASTDLSPRELSSFPISPPPVPSCAEPTEKPIATIVASTTIFGTASANGIAGPICPRRKRTSADVTIPSPSSSTESIATSVHVASWRSPAKRL
jgi:hypothetical protein